jgi:hypothetical protein
MDKVAPAAVFPAACMFATWPGPQESPDRPNNVLELLLANVNELDRVLAANLVS